jgi:hypothetical protein
MLLVARITINEMNNPSCSGFVSKKSNILFDLQGMFRYIVAAPPYSPPKARP